MGKTYTAADEDIVDMIGEAMDRYHPTLKAVGVTISELVIDDFDDATGESVPALKCNGYPATATIGIVSLKHRALGIGDALLTIDAATWQGLPVRKRLAVIDHELTHLEVRAEGGGTISWDEAEGKLWGVPKLDDLQRPKLRLRLHDVQIGAFREVAKRHGEASAEAEMVKSILGADGQVTWDFEATQAGQEALAGMGLRSEAEAAADGFAEAMKEGGARLGNVSIRTTGGREVIFDAAAGKRLRGQQHEASPAE